MYLERSIKIENEIDILHLSHNVNNYLISLSSGMYEYNFNWDLKESLIHSYYPREPYNEEEICKIIEYEKNLPKFALKNLKRRIPLGLYCDIFRESGVFDTKCKTIKTKEACFLYDTLAYLKVIVEDEFSNNQDKYQYIKGKLNR